MRLHKICYSNEYIHIQRKQKYYCLYRVREAYKPIFNIHTDIQTNIQANALLNKKKCRKRSEEKRKANR